MKNGSEKKQTVPQIADTYNKDHQSVAVAFESQDTGAVINVIDAWPDAGRRPTLQ